MAYSNYVPVVGTIQSFEPLQSSCCSRLLTLSTDNGIITFVVSENTYIVDNQRLHRGMQAVVFYDANLPVPLIFPPRYRAEIIAPINRSEMVAFHTFDNRLVAQDNSLQLNLSPATLITTTNGQPFTCNLRNRQLLVFYTNTTRSIPPQTTPRRIIVFC